MTERTEPLPEFARASNRGINAKKKCFRCRTELIDRGNYETNLAGSDDRRVSSASNANAMSSTNINDPAAVLALLEQLKSSAAWQELETSNSPNTAPNLPPLATVSSINTDEQPRQVNSERADISSSPSTGASVASLLSQLQPFTGNTSATHTTKAPRPFEDDAISSSLTPFFEPIPGPSNISSSKGDLRGLTFRESLPLLSKLADDPSFVTSIKKMKEDQNTLERSLWAEREGIYTKYHDKFKVAQTKAQLIGTTVSRHEVDMMTDAFKKEIFKFDHERVIPAWDGLVSRQQLELAQANTPTMFVSSNSKDRERQHQVINVLETVVGTKPA